MLQKTNIPISFAQGLDTKVDPKQVVAGKFLLLQNAIFTTPGELRKRNGYTAFTQSTLAGGTVSSGVALATFNDELLEFDGSFLYTYDVANTAWVQKGRTIGLQIEQFSVAKNSNNLFNSDMAQHANGLQLFTWTDSLVGPMYTIVDSTTGAVVVPHTPLPAGVVHVKPFALGNFFVIIYVQISTHFLRMVSIPVTAPLSPAAPVTIFSAATVNGWDGTLTGSNLTLVISPLGLANLQLLPISPTLVVGSPVVIAGQGADGVVSITLDAALSQLWVSSYDTTDIKYSVYTTALTPVLAPITVEAVADVQRIISHAVNGTGTLWYEQLAMATYNELIRFANATNLGVVSTPAVFLRSVGIESKPFVVNGVTYFTVVFDSLQQPTYFIVNSLAQVVGKALPLSAGPLLQDTLVPEALQLTPGLVTFTSLVVDQLETTMGKVLTLTGVVRTTLDFNSTDVFYKISISKTLQITGGILKEYDGVNLVETGFNVYPEGLVSTQGGGGSMGNASVATQYQYMVTYTWYDNNGQINNSFPSIPDDATTIQFNSGITTGSNSLLIPTLRLTDKTDVLINVFRTTGNGTIFYQLTNGGNGLTLFNDPTVDFVTFVDTEGDAAIQGNPIIYTTGNVVGNDGPPAPKLITQYINRLMLVPSENPLQIWFSEEAVPSTALNFSALFTINVDARGGAITAMQQMDNYLIIFKQNNIFFLTGQGPDNTGGQNDFINPTLVTSDSGCNNAHSVVQTPVGIMYQTPKGVYLLGRTLQVEYIGAPVEEFNQYHITSAQLIPTTTQVRFTMEAIQTSLVYDYFMKQWSVFTGQDAQDSALYRQQFTYIQPNGLVLQEAPGVFTDAGAFIPLVMTTSWLSLAQLQGFQRAYRALILGEYKSPHTLSVGVAYDFDPTVAQTDLIDTSPASTERPYEWRVDFRRQTCTSIQFTIQDLQSSSFGEGMSISAINLMIGAKVGTNKLAQSRIYS